jgi:putative pyruvate formate lyase activating enzyme
LHIPLVYNSGAYDRVKTLKLLEGIVDIYMPDFKFWEPEISRKLCQAPDYPEHARRALQEMHRQVGDLAVDSEGIARRGLIIRHLVMPSGMAGTEPIMQFIADNISIDSYVNIMTQYRPCGRAEEIKGLSNYPSQQDFDQAYRAAAKAGLTRLDRPRRLFIWR